MKQIIVLLLVLLGAFSCRPKNKEGRHEILRIRNDSDKDLYYTQLVILYYPLIILWDKPLHL